MYLECYGGLRVPHSSADGFNREVASLEHPGARVDRPASWALLRRILLVV